MLPKTHPAKFEGHRVAFKVHATAASAYFRRPDSKTHELDKNNQIYLKPQIQYILQSIPAKLEIKYLHVPTDCIKNRTAGAPPSPSKKRLQLYCGIDAIIIECR